VYLSLSLPVPPERIKIAPITTATLGKVLLTGLGYTHPDGSQLAIDRATTSAGPAVRKSRFPGLLKRAAAS
jgi:hypothetical protein